MKKAFVYLLFFSGLISLFSCEDTDYQIYDKNQKDKLFFYGGFSPVYLWVNPGSRCRFEFGSEFNWFRGFVTEQDV